ncbi:hypothetical protein Anapl_07170 [Anas platyrhynchos]|uniref:Uncharacterized protein n=1 Tax=Anas platyrhynchos TaxID=8839 RepID=R0LD87_ANAPL|nr:hypothetical protein Anapl_07170 [Anas platyrhynchos]
MQNNCKSLYTAASPRRAFRLVFWPLCRHEGLVLLPLLSDTVTNVDGRWKESFCYLEKAPELKQTEDPVATPCTTGYEWTREEYVAASKENEVVIHNLFVGRTRSIPSSKTDFQGPQHWGVESNQKVMRTSTPVCSEAFKVQSQDPRKWAAPHMAPEAMWGLLQRAEPGNAHSAYLDFKFLSLTLGIYSRVVTAASLKMLPWAADPMALSVSQAQVTAESRLPGVMPLTCCSLEAIRVNAQKEGCQNTADPLWLLWLIEVLLGFDFWESFSSPTVIVNHSDLHHFHNRREGQALPVQPKAQAMIAPGALRKHQHSDHQHTDTQHNAYHPAQRHVSQGAGSMFRNLGEGRAYAEEEGAGPSRPCSLDEIQEPTESAQEQKFTSGDEEEPLSKLFVNSPSISSAATLQVFISGRTAQSTGRLWGMQTGLVWLVDDQQLLHLSSSHCRRKLFSYNQTMQLKQETSPHKPFLRSTSRLGQDHR